MEEQLLNKVLRDKAFNIAKNPKYDGYWHGLASMVFFIYIYIYIQNLLAEQLKMKLSLLKNYKNQLLENLRKEKHTHLL